MSTASEALKAYQKARDELLKIVGSYEATDEQTQKATEAAQKLADDFIKDTIVKVSEISARYQQFITDMKATIKSLEESGPTEVVADLKDALNNLKPIFE